MKVSIEQARGVVKTLMSAGAEFAWKESTLHGTWLSFVIKSVYCDRVEELIEGISEDYAYEICPSKGVATFDLYDFTSDIQRTSNVESKIIPKVEKHIIKVRQWITRTSRNPIPMRTMEGIVVRETARAVLVKLNGLAMPSKQCLHCGRTLTHPVSVLYGIGPVCGGHFHINPCNSEEELQNRIADISERLSNVTWEGWLPKSAIESMSLAQ